jgi:hypothetical protein
LYKDHDMKKDPAMEIFNKYKIKEPGKGAEPPV